MEHESGNAHEDHHAKPSNNVLMAILAYIGPLVIISYLVAKNEHFVKFHIKQGLVIFVIEVVVWIASMVLFFLWPILWIINVFTFILSIIGIINAASGSEKQLPLVGQYGDSFKI